MSNKPNIRNLSYYTQKIKDFQKILEKSGKVKYLSPPLNCPICHEKKISTKQYHYKNFTWTNGYLHYLTKHHAIPKNNFMEAILTHMIRIKNKKIKIPSISYVRFNQKYMKIDRNQMLIIDALLTHGGVSKKYFADGESKYSEHAGLLDFNQDGLERIIVSGKTSRSDSGDEEIFLPSNMTDALDYEYIYHTHPPTPKAGSRAKHGILYEFPSSSDIVHFIEHHNYGEIQGSMVITPEGLYVIRKTPLDHKKIKLSGVKTMQQNIDRALLKIQAQAIKKYGIKFSQNDFYSKIAQDTEYIDLFNQVLKKYHVYIEYVSRKRSKNLWYIDTFYLPVSAVEPLSQKI